MNPISKALLYVVVVVKILFVLSTVRLYVNEYLFPDVSKKKEIEHMKEKLHYTFILSMYMLLILLFNPFQNNIKINEPSSEAHHLKLLIFSLGLIQILHFDYSKIIYLSDLF
jgi:hypothetical protein